MFLCRCAATDHRKFSTNYLVRHLSVSPHASVLLLLSLWTVHCGGCDFDWEGVKNLKTTIDSNPTGFVSSNALVSCHSAPEPPLCAPVICLFYLVFYESAQSLMIAALGGNDQGQRLIRKTKTLWIRYPTGCDRELITLYFILSINYQSHCFFQALLHKELVITAV